VRRALPLILLTVLAPVLSACASSGRSPSPTAMVAPSPTSPAPTSQTGSSPNDIGCSLGETAYQEVSIAFASGELGLVAVNHESATGIPWAAIQRTANGGRTWQTVFLTDRLFIHQLAWTSKGAAVAATTSGLLVTRNQGTSWTLSPGQPVCSVQAPSPGTAYAVTSAGLYSITEPSMTLTP